MRSKNKTVGFEPPRLICFSRSKRFVAGVVYLVPLRLSCTKVRMTLLNSSFDSQTGLNKFIRRFELLLSEGTEIRQDIPSTKHFATLEQIHNWLKASGFIVEEEYGDYSKILLAK